MIYHNRHVQGDEHPVRRIALIWAVLCIIFIAVAARRIFEGQFPDPDDALRLVQVRDLLAGQSWFDVTQYRIDPQAGTLMHWSRLVDLPLALIIAALTPLVGQGMAETLALIIVPLLTLGAFLLAVGHLAWRLFGKDAATFACLCTGLLAPIVFQLQPMRIDHHGWQIFTIALALWAIAGRSAVKCGALAGVAMAAGLTISLEILPMVAAYGGVLAFRWFRNPDQRWWLVSYMQGLAAALTVLFFAGRGFADLVQHCDTVSPAHLGFFVITAMGTGIIAAVPSLSRLLLIAAFAAAGTAGLVFFGVSSPACVMTPFAALDPLVRDYWYLNVLEGRPVWEQNLRYALPTLVQLMAGLAACALLIKDARGELREWWTDYTLLLVASTLLAVFVWRSASFAAIIAAVPLGWLTYQLLARFRTARGLKGKLLPVAGLFTVLLPSSLVSVADMVIPEEQPENTATLVEESQCALRDNAARLDNLPSGTVFAPLDIGPGILVKSHQAVVATGHHRAEEAMHDVIRAFISPAAEAQTIIRARGAGYVAMCSDLAEVNLYAAAHPDGLAAQLIANDPPDWLEPVNLGGPEQFRVWRVRGTKPE